MSGRHRRGKSLSCSLGRVASWVNLSKRAQGQQERLNPEHGLWDSALAMTQGHWHPSPPPLWGLNGKCLTLQSAARCQEAGREEHGISILGPAMDGRLLVTVGMEACLHHSALGKSGSPIASVIM